MELTYNIHEIQKIASTLVEKFSSNVVLFYGEMGAGKTTLIKALVKELGSADDVSSPTYSLVNEYQGEDSLIFHFDLYRLKSVEEALDMGFEEYLNPDDVIFIEWPEKVLHLLPEKVDVITLFPSDNDDRSLKLSLNMNLTSNNLMEQRNFY
ncbi:tRNA (adenosine(37)-N6)-threonylcarbamoyltransferase complex ATPase subunit type 1 TsaE [Aegicerativicinus sediminis]